MEDKWHFALPIFQNISVGVRETTLPGGDAQVCETRYCSCANIPWQLCKSCFVADLGAAGFLLSIYWHLFFQGYPPKDAELPAEDMFLQFFIAYALPNSQLFGPRMEHSSRPRVARWSVRKCKEHHFPMSGSCFSLGMCWHTLAKPSGFISGHWNFLWGGNLRIPHVFLAGHRIFSWLCLKNGYSMV